MKIKVKNFLVAAGDKASIADLATLIVTSGQFRNVAGRESATVAVAAKNSDKVGTP